MDRKSNIDTYRRNLNSYLTSSIDLISVTLKNIAIKSKDRLYKMRKVLPQDGECWFCHTKEDEKNMFLDLEFSTFVHFNCLREELKKTIETNGKY